MRVITLEEHVAFPEMLELIPKEKQASPEHSAMMERMLPKLSDITGERLNVQRTNQNNLHRVNPKIR